MIDAELLKLGAITAPFLCTVYFGYLIAKRIHRNSVCFECSGKRWSFERKVVEDEKKITETLMFKCLDCGHERSKYVVKSSKK